MSFKFSWYYVGRGSTALLVVVPQRCWCPQKPDVVVAYTATGVSNSVLHHMVGGMPPAEEHHIFVHVHSLVEYCSAFRGRWYASTIKISDLGGCPQLR